jgi:glucose/arabinose dehydrogenase
MELVTSLPQFPVAMAFTSSTRVLITEKGGFGGVRPASVRIVESGTLVAEPLITFAEVETRSEMGLLGIALDPDYAANRLVYAYYTHGPSRRNRVVRFRDDGRLSQRDQDAEIVIGNIPADVCGNHQGGNIAFGRDRMLYVTVGDNGCNRCLSQSGETLAGKILRYTRDGGVPGDNPFASAPPPASSFFATGLRNSFDFTFHPTTGEIFATENGPNTNDELNRILRGQNYGWPYFECEQSINPPCSFDRPPNTAPLRCYPSVIAPTGLAFYTGSRYPSAFRGNLFFGDNNTGTLRRVVLDPSGTRIDSVDEAFLGGFGRIVDVVDAPDGLLYVLTDRDLRRVDFIPGG